MQKKDSTARKPATPASLSTARAAGRFYRLVTDESQPDEARHRLLEEFDQLCNHTGVSLEHPAFFRRAFLLAATGTEELPRRTRGQSLDAHFAWQAYDTIQRTLQRIAAGESLASIHAAREAARARRHAALEAERLSAPEPQDKTSGEWRHWKLRRMEKAFDGRDGEAYARAWREFKALFSDLFTEPDFWHVSTALALLPHLLEARQRIDQTAADEKRSRAAMKGAQTRRRKGGAC